MSKLIKLIPDSFVAAFEWVLVLFIASGVLGAFLNVSRSVYLSLPLLAALLICWICVLCKERMSLTSGMIVLSLAWIAFLLYATVSWAVRPFTHPVSDEVLVKLFGFATVIFLAGIYAFRRPETTRRLLHALFAVSLLVMLIWLYYFIFRQYQPWLSERLTRNNYLSTGSYVGMVFIIGVAFALRARGRARIFCMLLSAAALVSVFFIGGRGPLLSAIVTACLVLALRVDVRWISLWKVAMIFGGIILCIALSLVFFDGLREDVLSSRVLRLLEPQRDTSTMVRVELFSTALRMFWESPLFGGGLGSFMQAIPRSVIGLHYPHNIFLEVLCEFGVIGFILVFGFILFPALKKMLYVMKRADDIYTLAISMLFVYYLFWGMISGSLYQDRFIWLLAPAAFPLAASVVKSRASKSGFAVIAHQASGS